MLSLRDRILPPDRNEFGLGDIEYTDERKFFAAAAKGASFYLLKEPEDRTQARRHYRRYNALQYFNLSVAYKILNCSGNKIKFCDHGILT
jgi:hypothetical protein